MVSFDKVDAEIAKGQLWRAKEILRGRVGNSGFDSALFERYGAVLLSTADLYEAGKFLFLSGARDEKYAHAIRLFIERHQRRQPSRIFNAFPKCVQNAEVSCWPQVVVEDLRNVGVDLAELKRAQKKHVSHTSSLKNKIVLFVVLLLLAGLVIAFLIGVGVGLKTILGWIFR